MKSFFFLLMFALVSCASAAYKPPPLPDFLQGDWVRTGIKCKESGSCQRKGPDEAMRVEGEALAIQKTIDAPAGEGFVFRPTFDGQLQLTHINTGQTKRLEIRIKKENLFLLQSREWPEFYEKWQRP
ncbi:MAG: hypothetical protein HS115_00060 [Spirochaetales bacterium]|nr:hypothetical protein [Spirochaetales bacterium]